MVGAVVGLQLIGLAVEGEGGVLDPVCIAAHKGAAVGGGVPLVLLQGVVAQHHIHRPAFGGDDDILDDRPVSSTLTDSPPGLVRIYSLTASPF